VTEQTTRVSGIGLVGAILAAEPDPDTNFTLFDPSPTPPKRPPEKDAFSHCA